jgi:hypothetical protein
MRIKQVLLSPDRLGLIILDGTVIPPRPFWPWRARDAVACYLMLHSAIFEAFRQWANDQRQRDFA